MKKLLFQLDTDTHPAVFDTVVGYDGGADHVIGHGGCTPQNVRPLVEGAIFTRAPKDKKFTALFIGGSDMNAGMALFTAVQKVFFADFRVSIMLDSNGSNTTAAAGVARLAQSGKVAGQRAVVLAGTGPVGQRAAVMLAREGAQVAITSRDIRHAEECCTAIRQRFNVDVEPLGAATNDDRGRAIEKANVVFATGKAGICLLDENHWKDNPDLRLLADANATPPIGITGTDMMDRGKERHGKIVWGAIGFGTLKLALHRACIARLFEGNDAVLDAETIFALAKRMA
jgi:threonine dehydrogenase-like Zn-dependent dehydrogenase